MANKAEIEALKKALADADLIIESQSEKLLQAVEDEANLRDENKHLKLQVKGLTVTNKKLVRLMNTVADVINTYDVR